MKIEQKYEKNHLKILKIEPKPWKNVKKINENWAKTLKKKLLKIIENWSEFRKNHEKTLKTDKNLP